MVKYNNQLYDGDVQLHFQFSLTFWSTMNPIADPGYRHFRISGSQLQFILFLS